MGRQNGAAPGPDIGLDDDFEALLASVGIPTGLANAGGEQALVPVGSGGVSGGGARMKRYPLASNAVLELLPRPGAACRSAEAQVVRLRCRLPWGFVVPRNLP